MIDIDRYREQVEEAADFIRPDCPEGCAIGIVLGTGLSGLRRDLNIAREISYADIPHFPVSTVEFHSGRLLAGSLSGVPVLAMEGRFHLYEGYDARQVTFPIRVMHALGIRTLLISNAAGGMNEIYRRADLMLIADHINLLGVNPLTGPNAEEWGPRFPDMSEPYDPELRVLARSAAADLRIRMHEGVYVAVTGPNLETPAEYRYLRRIGADAVGMSTVPEVIAARHMGMQVMAVSVITDECFPDTLQPISIEDVLAAAREAEPHLQEIFKSLVTAIHQKNVHA